MRRARFWFGACLSLAAGTTVPARHPAANPFIVRPAAQPNLPTASLAAALPEGTPTAASDAQAQLAIAFNATIPLVSGALTAAQPFYLRGPAEDMARATDCLAAAGYYEAGGGAADQRAVAQVVLNRVRHRAFPATVCGVVFEGSERTTGCQFTFTCDGALQRRTPSPAAWRAARQIAAEMLLGQVDPTVGLATHYHTDWVSPAWDRTMDKIAVVRTHLFYRWRGQQSFAMRQGGSEPAIGQLTALSDAHRAAAGLDDALGTPPASPTGAQPPHIALVMPAVSTGQMTAPAPLFKPASSEVFLVTLPAGGSPASFRALAEQRCAGLSRCRFIGWTDPARTPAGLPMPGSSVDAIAFVFERRSAASEAIVRWDCGTFATQGAAHCI